MLRIINEIRTDIKNDCYLSALMMALSIPDICSKAVSSDKTTSRSRYIKWFDDNLVDNYRCKEDLLDPELTGEVLYELRCSIFHSGFFDLQNKSKIKGQDEINEFRLYADKLSNNYVISGTINDRVVIEVNIVKLCELLCLLGEFYYKNNIEIFNEITKTFIYKAYDL